MTGPDRIAVFGTELLALAHALTRADPQTSNHNRCLNQAAGEVMDIVHTLGETLTPVEYRALLAAIARRIIQVLAQAEELVDG